MTISSSSNDNTQEEDEVPELVLVTLAVLMGSIMMVHVQPCPTRQSHELSSLSDFLTNSKGQFWFCKPC